MRILTYSLFVIYWVLTIFFTFPDNYLKIKVLEYEKVFSMLLYQEWRFFAPPPQANDRLIYQFERDSDTLVIEVFESLHKLKSEKYLTNDNVTIISDILSTSANGVEDFIRDDFANFKFNYCDSDSIETDCFKAYYESNEIKIHDLPELITLRNYGLQLYENRKLKSYSGFRILLGKQPILKFNDRFKKESTELFSTFKSRLYNVRLKSWDYQN